MAFQSTLPYQRTPGRPVEIDFAPQTTPPPGTQTVTLIGHAPSGMAPSGLYKVYQVANFADTTHDAVTSELTTLLGGDCELLEMVLAAIDANAVSGNFPPLNVLPLASTDTDFGSALAALDKPVESEFIVSPYDASDTALTDDIRQQAALMSAPARVSNQQFGTTAVAFNRSVTDPTTLHEYDDQNLMAVWMPDSHLTGPYASTYTVAQSAAAAAALAAGNPVPFNPLDAVIINDLPAPQFSSDYVSVGYGLESETALLKGWTPLQVLNNGSVAFVRTITTRLTQGGSGPTVTAYFDLQDFQVLYYWRKTLYTRFSQPDLTQVKASINTADNILSEVIRLAKLFEDQQMFQAVDQLAKQFVVQRNSVDRSRFDVLTPVNVIPGLHEIATTVEATTEFDSLSI